ncbi:hypothetical protein AVEN_248810-1 [Araneus ventricosus]|uniref:Uncharacterized protein n=1 Tax=Araneus ventricosus TaxID=182803 RepID=A0A4Y2J702_ARAVE|nr:hypothetical protein AVEN_248810-1 [Araneus ventricosus]
MSKNCGRIRNRMEKVENRICTTDSLNALSRPTRLPLVSRVVGASSVNLYFLASHRGFMSAPTSVYQRRRRQQRVVNLTFLRRIDQHKREEQHFSIQRAITLSHPLGGVECACAGGRG